VEAQPGTAQRRDPTWLGVWAIVFTGVTAIVWLALIALVPLGPAFLLTAVVVATQVCVLATVWFSPRPLAWRTVLVPALMGTLAAWAPMALVVFLRLSVKACAVLNPLGLPWDEPWREIMHWGGGIVWLASCTMVVVGFAVARLRPSAVVMLVWSALSVVPAFLLLFFMFYGDPAAGCTPV